MKVIYLIGSIGHVLRKIPYLTVLSVFGLSHVLKSLSHAGATMRQLDTPDASGLIDCAPDLK